MPSYFEMNKNGAPGRIRTSDPLVRSQILYPTELRARVRGGERGIRTLDGLLAHTPLAGERLRPLGHLSGQWVASISGIQTSSTA
ncbi:hypothetical protein Llon_1231 [Legionella londiniensis]|uniref:Uncharacterized protein n=1 Tax=Legionella londiniensis TaxID=45068 RepID=A0A0W0VML0_9GAMM|nr:hypothetical protein Llon_1231 [Legionella londiniensis]